MTPATLVPGDVVATVDAAAAGREPLVVLDRLRAFLDAAGVGSGEPRLELIGEGRSNVTLAVRRGSATFVLRRPPRGSLAPGTHDVVREARVLQRLHGAARVPRVLAVCEDPSVIGAPFFVMEHVAGSVITDLMPPELDTPAGRRRVGEELVDALVEVHAVDWRGCGLTHRHGYLSRQLQRFAGLWERNRTRELPQVERVGRWLADHLPAEGGPTLVHGDYRLGNVVLAAGGTARIVAILDWEMATVGDPLADLGYLTALWPSRDEPPVEGLDEFVGVLRADGFPSREELVARYASGAGRAVADVDWHRVLALWKAAIFMEGNYLRARSAGGDGSHLAVYEASVPILAERAEQITRRVDAKGT